LIQILDDYNCGSVWFIQRLFLEMNHFQFMNRVKGGFKSKTLANNMKLV